MENTSYSGTHYSWSKYPWMMLISTYITQYIGVAFILSAAMAILRQQGAGLDKLALINLAVLPLVGKVFYAPIIDRYRISIKGKYRSWLVLAQFSMTILLLVAGVLDFQAQFNSILVVLAAYVFCMSIQDVAVDGLSCKLFDAQSRRLANSVQFSGNLMGNIIGGGLILMMYPWLQWQGALWLLAGLTAGSLLLMLLFKEPEESAQAQSVQVDYKSIFSSVKDFLKHHKSWFVVMALYPIGATCGFALLNPLLVDGGWQLGDIGFAMKIYGSSVGLVSALLATPFIARLGRINALVGVILIQTIALLLIVPITFGVTNKIMVYAAITAHFISFPALLVTSSTMMMDNAAHSLHKATLFTLQFSFASLLGFAYSSMSLAAAQRIGYSTVVIVGAISAVGIALLVKRILASSSAYTTDPTI